MSSKSQQPSQPASKQRRISFRIFLLVVGTLASIWFFLSPHVSLFGPNDGFGALFNEITPSTFREDLEQTTGSINAALNQVLSQLRAHTNGLSDIRRRVSRTKRADITGELSGAASTTVDDLAGALGTMVSQAVDGQGPLAALVDSVKEALSTGANALGAGLSDGALKGLDLESMLNSEITQPASDTGVNAIAWQLGEGASEAMLSKIDFTKVMSSANLSSAALALGSGLGNGTAAGLQLSTVAAPGTGDDGIGTIAGNLGYGLTDGLFSNIDFSTLSTTSMGQGIFKELAAIPAPAGKGLGEGAAVGMGLAPSSTIDAGNSSEFDTASASEDFMRSLASSFLSTADLTTLAEKTNLIGPAAEGLGEGIGSGAATAFGLATDPKPVVNGTNVESIMDGFGYSLTRGFLSSDTIATMLKLASVLPKVNPVRAAQGMGRGIGHGAAFSFDLQPDVEPNTKSTAVPDIMQGFSESLTKSFLANGTIDHLIKIAKSQMLSIKPLLAAEGFGKGIGGGMGNALGAHVAGPAPNATDVPSIAQGFSQSMTYSFLSPEMIQILKDMMAIGLGPLIDALDLSKLSEGFSVGLIAGGSQVILEKAGIANASQLGSTTFNDSIHGASTGFGRGLGSEGAKVIFMALGSEGITNKMTGLIEGTSNGTSNSTSSRRDLVPVTHVKREDAVNVTAMVDFNYTAAAGVNATDVIDELVHLLNMTKINGLVQKGIDTLGCTGMGGMVQVALGVYENNKAEMTKLTKMTPIPVDTILNITQNGNLYQINLENETATINGLSTSKLAALMITHTLFGFSFFFMVPSSMILEAARDLAILVGRPDKLQFTTKMVWGMQIPMPIFAIIAAGLGAGLTGSAAHGHTAHEVMGWLTMVLAMVGLPLYVAFVKMPGNLAIHRARNGVALLTLIFSSVVVLLGFADVNDMTFCATQAVPFPLSFAGGAMMAAVVWIAVAALLMRWLVSRWIASRSAVTVEDISKKG